jgi:predicted ATPase/DNA-binding winged helix-turn-helix (wHTH) protein
MIADRSRLIYTSGECEIDLARRELRVQGAAAPIGSRAFEIIEVLAQSTGRLIAKDELLDRIWPGAIVSDNALQVHISAVRRALGPCRQLLKTELGRGYRLLGDWAVRQDRPEEASVVSFQQSGSAARSPRSQDTAEARTGNLPAYVTDLVGRADALPLLRELLSAYRVVTLTGPGGIGKTTLAIHAARDLCAALTDGGGWLVELGSLSDPELVPSAVASALQLDLGGGGASGATIAGIIGDENLLLVLDNCEHVIDAAANLAEMLVRSCPRVTILATSREVLRIEGEYVYRVPPLAVPPEHPEPGEPLRFAAVQLFIARTRAQGTEFSGDPIKLSTIASICRRLDGIPLAIELAAASATTLGIEELAGRLDDRLSLLIKGRRTALPRHQALRATLDWSHELLSEAERIVFRRLSLFAGTFGLRAAAAVAAEPAIPPAQVVVGLSDLVSKSLVTVEAGGVVRRRYRLLDTTRDYALEKLDESGERKMIARRHAEYYRGVFERAEAEWKIRPAAEWVADYGPRIDNLRCTLDWAFSPEGDASIGVRLTIVAIPLWMHMSLMEECRGRVEQALAVLNAAIGGDTRFEMQLNAALGWSIAFTRRNGLEMQAALTKALQLAEGLGDVDHQLRSLWGLWLVEDRNALRVAQQFSALAVTPADRLIGERMIGCSYHFRGNQRSAKHHIERALAYDTGHDSGLSIIRFQMDQRLVAQAYLARILWLQGFPERALRTAQNAVEHLQAIDHANSLCTALAYAACPIALWVGNLDLAEHYIGHLHDVSTTHVLTLWRESGRAYQGLLFVKRGDLQGGIPLLRAAFDALYVPTFSGYRVLIFLGELAEALGLAGQVSEGLATVERAIDRAEHTAEGWIMAELLRVKGELVRLDGASLAEDSAKGCFLQALQLARTQGALSWELRAATSMARLLRDQGRSRDAAAILQQVYGRFTEGFDTADMRAARAILETVSL